MQSTLPGSPNWDYSSPNSSSSESNSFFPTILIEDTEELSYDDSLIGDYRKSTSDDFDPDYVPEDDSTRRRRPSGKRMLQQEPFGTPPAKCPFKIPSPINPLEINEALPLSVNLSERHIDYKKEIEILDRKIQLLQQRINTSILEYLVVIGRNLTLIKMTHAEPNASSCFNIQQFVYENNLQPHNVGQFPVIDQPNAYDLANKHANFNFLTQEEDRIHKFMQIASLLNIDLEEHLKTMIQK